MGPWLNNPTFFVYAMMAIVLCLNILGLWAYSGLARGKTKTVVNPEDATRPTVSLVEAEPPEVARILRAHTNAQANIYPFLFLGMVYVAAGGSQLPAMILFGIFTFARLLHTFAYVGGKQPWRTLGFLLGLGTTLALVVAILVALFTQPSDARSASALVATLGRA